MKRGDDLVVQPVTADARLHERVQVQERVDAILRRAKLRAAALAEQATADEAWVVYDRAAETLGQAC